MGKYSGILLCSDFDGTLAYQTAVPQANIDAIEYFCAEGGIFSVISGRTPDFIARYSRSLCLNSYVACINGAMICHAPSGRIIKKTELPDGAKAKISDILDELDGFMDINVFTDSGSLAFEGADPDCKGRVLACFDGPVYKLLIHKSSDFTEGEASLIKQAFGSEYEVARSWSRGLEISNALASKGVAAREMAHLVGAHTLVCVGDYENDISLLEAADISYAVDNALPRLKHIASKTTVDVRVGAIAAIIKEL